MSIEVVEIESSGLSGISVVEVNQGPTGPAGPASEAEVKSSSFTAEVDGLYHVVASATATDPATPEEGKGFSVFVRNGTATVGGVAYATAGTIIERIYHSGSYTNYVYKIDSTYATAAQGTLADGALQRSGGTMTGTLTMGSNRISSTGQIHAAGFTGGTFMSQSEASFPAGISSGGGITANGEVISGFTIEGTSSVASPTFTDVAGTGPPNFPYGLSTNTVSSTELGYLDGVTSAIQTQLNARLPLAGGTLTGEVISTKSGAASVSALKVSGVPFAGTGTTSFPLVYINDSNATASTTLNTAGTYLGVNGDGTQDLMNLMKDGVSQFKVSGSGDTTISGQSLTGSQATSLATLRTTWNTTGAPTALDIDVTNTASDANGSYLINLKTNGVSQFFVRKDGYIIAKTIQTSAGVSDTSGNRYVLDQSSGFGRLNLAGTGCVFSMGTTNAQLSDTGIGRGAAKVIDLNNGTSGTGGTWRAVPTSPAQISSDQNDYNPAGSSYYQRWSTDASRTVTGLTFTAAQVDGQSHVIVNVGANDLVLANESASSTAANRFKTTTGADITLTANQQATIFYDATTARWRVSKNN